MNKIENTKESIFRFERHNFGAVLFAKSGNFWVARENSALFLDRVLRAQVKVKPDYDKYVNRDIICASVHVIHFHKVLSHVEQKKCAVHQKDDLVYIKLPKEVTPETIRKWKVDEEAMKVRIDAYFMPDTGEVKLYSLIRDLGREIIIAERQMSDNMKAAVGSVMMTTTVAIEKAYRGMAEDSKGGEVTIKKLVGDLSFIVMIAHDERLIGDRNAMRMGRILKNIVRCAR